ncbi:hypothetical protein H8S90_09355 [Olivibacter sp. SDN3]|uniref:hypothetical protein n=1 Tax=Olivibacter sp. SDN3 TaxID=2764720 RepID=UPI0016513792|nr:hypothetical protein [Olivibacter sp. SDN3]QNL51756.1 hypothetical protein H8S90_09355 [Olivibacter sp. SDN3]
MGYSRWTYIFLENHGVRSLRSAGTSRADSYAIQVILASYPHRSRKSYSGLWVKDR